MALSKLCDCKIYSPNHSGYRTQPITKITVHHMAGVMTAYQCGQIFQNPNRQASSNYGIGWDGSIGGYVDENNRSWATSSSWNDNRAVTIEVSNDKIGGEWHVSDAAYKSLIRLIVDICVRNNIKKLDYTGNIYGSLTRHNMFAATACAGPYLSAKFPQIANDVNGRLGTKVGWINEKGKWWYQNADGSYPANRWAKIDYKWYYFDKKGYMKKGWLEDKGRWYYLTSNGSMAIGWLKLGSKWYLFNQSGSMVVGWAKVNNRWYYMNKGGAMVVGWLGLGKDWYYFTSSGAMVNSAFAQIKKKWYAFESDGKMKKDTIIKVGKDGKIVA